MLNKELIKRITGQMILAEITAYFKIVDLVMSKAFLNLGIVQKIHQPNQRSSRNEIFQNSADTEKSNKCEIME
jgi:hypothetical protein